MEIGIIVVLVIFGVAMVYAYRCSTRRRVSNGVYQPDYGKRDCSLAPGCKDLIDVIRLQRQPARTALPPITRRVTLPEVVAVRYIAELLKLSKEEVSALCGYFGERSLPFDQAQKILRNYGIWADKTA